MRLGGPQGQYGRAVENLTFIWIQSADLEPEAVLLDNINMDMKEKRVSFLTKFCWPLDITGCFESGSELNQKGGISYQPSACHLLNKTGRDKHFG